MKRLVGAEGKALRPRTSGKENLWILKLLDNAGLAADLNYSAEYLVAKASGVAWGKGLCVACKGGKFLCGKTRCPLLVRVNFYLKTMPLIKGLDVDGALLPACLWAE